ncbi:MAG TPA: hypothetical protein VGQ42_17585 [Candidatus Dormibacteraeota bacterium]|jgi:hypothetical protein|nr:hypothetical protein [Candidatus Dormibacteraeota bacterium]
MAKVKKPSFAKDTSWDGLGWDEYDNGARISSFILGHPDDPDAPVIFTGVYPPGSRTEAHHHVNDYAEILLEGSQQITGKWHHAGDVRIVKAGTGYGPLIAGPEGCRTVVIFRNQDWMSRGGRMTKAGDGETPTTREP